MGRSNRPRNRNGNGASPAPSPGSKSRHYLIRVLPAHEQPDREEALADVINEAERVIHTLDRLGGSYAVSPLREGPIDETGEYATTGFLFYWNSYAPGMVTELESETVQPLTTPPPAAADEAPAPEPEPTVLAAVEVAD